MRRALLFQPDFEGRPDFEAFAAGLARAEALGFETAWCLPTSDDDGVFRDEGLVVWLAGLAARTQRIRLGIGIAGLCPPSHPPMRLAEQLATLDLASDGRIELGVIAGPGLDAPDPDWDEGLRMVLEMGESATFSWGSPRFTVPPVDVVPKPVQRPGLPCSLIGWRREHAVAAGGVGLRYLDVSGSDPDARGALADAYQAAYRAADPTTQIGPASYAVVEAAPAEGIPVGPMPIADSPADCGDFDECVWQTDVEQLERLGAGNSIGGPS